MGKYNASPDRFGLAPAVRKLAHGLLLAAAAGCASDPSTAQVETSSAPPPAQPVPAEDTVDAVDDLSQATAAAGSLSLRESAPLHYTVKKGDTLWGIATYYLRDAWQWPQLWYENGQIKNPHLIYPGDVLTLVMVNGQPRVTLVEDRLHPRIHEMPLDQAIPAIPIDAVREFLRGPRLVTKEEADKAPYVVEFTDEALIAGQNEGVYVKNLPKDPVSSWALVKIGKAYKDPDTDKMLGYDAIPTGEADLREVGPPATMVLTKSPQEVEIGNRLLPLEPESFKADFYPHAPAKPVTGRIISIYGGVMEVAQFNIVAITRGSEDGLDPGTVLGIYQPGHKVPDPYSSGKVELPEAKAGELMVFKVTPHLSYGLVMSETRAAHINDKVHGPAASKH
jgi:nucleoid-associated protein YgaU